MLINPWPWIAALILLGGLYGAHRYYVHIAVKQAIVQIEQKYQTAYNQAQAKAKATEDELRINENNLRKDKDATISRIGVELAATQRLLQLRPSRPSTGAPTGSSQSCTGRELYKEDGLFLAGEAARAEALIAERDYYFNAYEDARKKLDGR